MHSGGAGGTSVLIVDDHALVREALVSRLKLEPTISGVETASSGDEALVTCRRSPPSVVLLDVDLPGMGAFDAARRICELCPDARVIFLSAYHTDQYISEALASGASGYVSKSEPIDALLEAIRLVVAGEVYFSPQVRSRIIVEAGGLSLASQPSTRQSTLTSREKEVLRHLALGKSKKQIATELEISVNTVDVHTTRIMTKLDIHDRVELARYAIREGLVEP